MQNRKIQAPIRTCVDCASNPKRIWNEFYLCKKCAKARLNESLQQRKGIDLPEPRPKQGDIPY